MAGVEDGSKNIQKPDSMPQDKWDKLFAGDQERIIGHFLTGGYATRKAQESLKQGIYPGPTFVETTDGSDPSE